MLLIFGTRPFESVILYVMMICPHCHAEAQQRVFKVVHRLTLFFIPLFPVSTKHFVECSNCGALTALTKEQVAHSIEWAAARSGG